MSPPVVRIVLDHGRPPEPLPRISAAGSASSWTIGAPPARGVARPTSEEPRSCGETCVPLLAEVPRMNRTGRATGVVASSSHLESASFELYRTSRRAGEPKAAPGEAPTRQRSLWRLYKELYAILEGHRGSIALAMATLSVSTLLRLLPPAATKLVIDYVLLRRPLPGSVTSRVPIPDDPKARLILLVAAVLVVSTVGLVVGLWGRWRATLASKRVQVAVRRRVFEHAVRLPLHRVYQLKSGGASSLIRDDAGGGRRADFQHALQSLAGGRAARGRGRGPGLARLEAAARGRSAWRPGRSSRTGSGTSGSGRSSATSASAGRRSTPGRPRSSAGCASSAPSAASAASRPGSSARAT
jgi:hypothetical protein